MNTTAATRTTARNLTPGQTVMLNGPETITGLETETRRHLVRILTDKRDCRGLLLNMDVLVDVVA